VPAQTAIILQLDDVNAYEELVADAIANDRSVCVKFYATWCRSCKAVAPKYRRIANKWPDVEFYEIGFGRETSAIFKKKGIKALPVMQIIAGSRGAMQPFVCGPSKMARLDSHLGEATATDAVPTDEAVADEERQSATGTASPDDMRLPT